jgi:hypothetical protein
MNDQAPADPPAPTPSIPVELHYAPPQRGAQWPTTVLLTGIVTSAATLLVLFTVAYHGGPDFMSWHIFYLVPIGALLVGTVAGSGYGLASVWTGFRVSHYLACAIFLLQICVYFAAVYVHFRTLHLVYRATGASVPFGVYFNHFATAYTWRSANGQTSPLGNVGYFIRLIEIVGFALGGLFAPAFMAVKPYCQLCGIYMKTRHLMFFPRQSAIPQGEF